MCTLTHYILQTVQKYVRGLVHDMQFLQKVDDLGLAAVHTDGPDVYIVQGLEVNLRHGRVYARSNVFNESTQRLLRDHDFVNCDTLVSK
jgi:hypothetical protein